MGEDGTIYALSNGMVDQVPTQAFAWSYPDEKGTPFLSKIRGMSQRLANGNTLIVNSDSGEMFEVTLDQEVVWSWSCGSELFRARRYAADQVPFLKGVPRARPPEKGVGSFGLAALAMLLRAGKLPTPFSGRARPESSVERRR